MGIASWALCATAAVHFTPTSAELQLPALRYDYKDLEPHIDEATMRVHHLGHHAAYTAKTNELMHALRIAPETHDFAKMGVDFCLAHLEQIADASRRTALRQAGGGFLNHELYFDTLGPNFDYTQWSQFSAIGKDINAAFGSFDGFRAQFDACATSVFGSGWCWLVLEPTGALTINATANQDTPAMQPGRVPVLALDLWEHSYYLKHQNRRAAYIQSWWQVLDWQRIGERYDNALLKVASGHAHAQQREEL